MPKRSLPEKQTGNSALFRASVLTLFPSLFPGSLGVSLVGRALEAGLWRLRVVDLKSFASGGRVDSPPAGGGPGMVLRADVAGAAIDSVCGDVDLPLVVLSASGERMDQLMAREWVGAGGAHFLCGRFEGIDRRVIEARGGREVSVGDFVMAGGEVGAMGMIEACVRLLPGVMGKSLSGVEESFEGGLLEYPHYTRPREWEGREVPGVLLSGDHGAVELWRRGEAEERTRRLRPDLWRRYAALRRKD